MPSPKETPTATTRLSSLGVSVREQSKYFNISILSYLEQYYTENMYDHAALIVLSLIFEDHV